MPELHPRTDIWQFLVQRFAARVSSETNMAPYVRPDRCALGCCSADLFYTVNEKQPQKLLKVLAGGKTEVCCFICGDGMPQISLQTCRGCSSTT